jgi:hypothetical protein
MKLKPGDTVRVIGSQGTAKVRTILTGVHGALLEKRIGRFRVWNLDDLRLVKRGKSKVKWYFEILRFLISSRISRALANTRFRSRRFGSTASLMYILKSRTKNFGTIKLNGSLMIQAGQWSRITEIWLSDSETPHHGAGSNC